MFEPIALDKTVLHLRNKSNSENEILADVKSILTQNEEERDSIRKRLKTEEASSIENKFNFDLLETDRIIPIHVIEQLCVDYRLRFLDASLFKDAIPEEAITQIRILESKHGIQLQGFKIAAPSKAFNLKNYDDPLLFVPIGNSYYYLLHKWGNDLVWYRKLMVWPVKNSITFIFFCLFISLLFTWLTPTSKLSHTVEYPSLIVFLFMFKSIVGVVAYYFFMMGKNFNSEIWNRKFKEN